MLLFLMLGAPAAPESYAPPYPQLGLAFGLGTGRGRAWWG